MSASDVLDPGPQLVVRYSAPQRPSSGIPTEIVDLPQQIMEVSKKMVSLSHEIVELPQQTMELLEHLLDLSQQITNLNSQLFPHLNTLSQGPTIFPLQSPAQLITDYPPPLPVFQNAPLNFLFDKSVHESQLVVINPSAYRPLEPTNIFPTPYQEILSRQSVLQFPPLTIALERPPLTSPLPPPPILLPLEITSPAPISRSHEYGDCSETLPLATMRSTLTDSGSEEIRSVAVFVNKIRFVEFIPEDDPIQASIRLKDPCLNCLSLMERIPGTVRVLAATGWSQDIGWISGNRQKLAPEVQRRLAYGVLSFQAPRMSNQYDFLLSAAYGTTQEGIYQILEAYTVSNTSPFLSVEEKKCLSELWREFIIPFRENGAMFRLNRENNVDPIIIQLNTMEIPICTVFCALAYILSMVLSPRQVEAQRKLCYLPLIAVLAKWCATLCPWAHPNVVSVAYSTSSAPDIYFLLGTSKPSTQTGANLGPFHPINMQQMRGFRKILLERHFGRLQHPCPVGAAAESSWEFSI